MSTKKIQTFTPGTIPTKDWHQLMLGCIAPRPIAWVSTLSEDGVMNLAPYSFFNAFSSNPPIVVFSSNRRVGNNTTKDTLHNIFATKEAVINVVNFDLMRKMALTSVEFPADISEFEKAGLTPIPSEIVKPYRVAESPAQFECVVDDIITLGDKGGAGHLIICNVVKLHISEDVIDNNRIDPDKIDLVGRMGRAFYTRASGDAIHTLYQPLDTNPIGFNGLPDQVKSSSVLTANNIGALAALETWPKSISDLPQNLIDRLDRIKSNSEILIDEKLAKQLLDESETNALLAAYILQNS